MKIELSEQLGTGQHVNIRDPKKLSWGDQKQITAALKDDSMGSQLDTAERIALALVIDGYVLDADDKPVTFPLTADNIGNVPAVVIEEVAKAFGEVKSQSTPKN